MSAASLLLLLMPEVMDREKGRRRGGRNKSSNTIQTAVVINSDRVKTAMEIAMVRTAAEITNVKSRSAVIPKAVQNSSKKEMARGTANRVAKISDAKVPGMAAVMPDVMLTYNIDMEMAVAMEAVEVAGNCDCLKIYSLAKKAI